MHNSLYVFDNWEQNIGHKKKRYNYSKKIFIGIAKSMRMIGDPDNQLTDKWSSTEI